MAAWSDRAAWALIGGVVATSAFAVWIGRPLYADGAHYVLTLLTGGGFFHVAWTRVCATFLTQAPMVMAEWAGVADVAWLARLYSVGCYAVPVVAYAVTTWVTRRHFLLFAGNAIVIFVGFYPTSLLVMGEFAVLYAIFWLVTVLLVTGLADRPAGAAVVLGASLATVASYEISAVMGPLLVVGCVWRIGVSHSGWARTILALSIVPLLAGSFIGAWGILAPRDPANAGTFLHALTTLYRDPTLLGLTGLFVAAGLVSVVPLRYQWVGTAGLIVACISFVVLATVLHRGTSFGQAYSHRAQVVPIILAVSIVCAAGVWLHRDRAWTSQSGRLAWPLLLPVLVVLGLDVRDSLGWLRFLDAFCTTLADPSRDPTDLPHVAAARRYGWGWTYPTLSVLLRPAGSAAMVINPGPGWQPFDPNGPVPDIDRLKTQGGLCRIIR